MKTYLLILIFSTHPGTQTQVQQFEQTDFSTCTQQGKAIHDWLTDKLPPNTSPLFVVRTVCVTGK